MFALDDLLLQNLGDHATAYVHRNVETKVGKRWNGTGSEGPGPVISANANERSGTFDGVMTLKGGEGEGGDRINDRSQSDNQRHLRR